MHLTLSTITNFMASVYMCRHNNITKNDIDSYKYPYKIIYDQITNVISIETVQNKVYT